MHRSVYRFVFAEDSDMEEVEAMLILAILAVGCLCGGPAIRLNAVYAVDAGWRTVVVDGTTRAGLACSRAWRPTSTTMRRSSASFVRPCFR